eukprot:6197223-Pleurochrysis_carterae.AAC.1
MHNGHTHSAFGAHPSFSLIVALKQQWRIHHTFGASIFQVLRQGRERPVVIHKHNSSITQRVATANWHVSIRRDRESAQDPKPSKPLEPSMQFLATCSLPSQSTRGDTMNTHVISGVCGEDSESQSVNYIRQGANHSLIAKDEQK